MALYRRLMKLDEPGLPVHQFMAMLGEVERGKVSAASAASAFGLSVDEQTEATALIARIVTPLESISLGGFATLSNIGTAYDTITASRGLGLCRVQTAGVTKVELTVSVQKIGTGTQSWQLWNETDGTEVTVINDAGATGFKTLSIVHTFPSPLGASVKLLRIRAKSTVAADDPVFLGATILITRVDRLTAEELHQVLLLAEQALPPYTTEGSVTARLGV